MKTLIQYISEKLVVNKNFKPMTNDKNFTKEMCDALVKEIEDNYAKYYDKNNIINKSYCYTDYKNKDYFNDVIKLGIFKFDGGDKELDEIIKKDDNVVFKFQFEIKGLKNINIVSYVYNDHFSTLQFCNAKVSQLKIVKSVLEKNGYEMCKSSNVCPFTWNSPYIFYSHTTFINIYDIDEICDIINKTVNKLGLDDVSNWTIKPGEVLPGWTIDDIKKRYDNIFDDIRVMRSGNVKLGHLKEHGIDHSYENSTFRIDTDIEYRNGIMVGRRLDGSSGSGNNFVLEPSTDKAFDELDKKLRKKGYTV